jgi:hypothetical protein
MKPKFQLSINSVSIVHELPGTWSATDCLALLNQLEFGDTADIPKEQLRDYAVMALQDLEDDEAAGVLLNYIFGDELSSGKIQNLSDEMTERIFNAQFLLNQAYPNCQQPEINKVVVTLTALNQDAEAYLRKYDPDTSGKSIPEQLLVRCFATALPDNSILNRLFDDQIIGKLPFGEAMHILWHVHAIKVPGEAASEQRFELTLYSPTRWTGSLDDGIVVECEPFIRDIENADT